MVDLFAVEEFGAAELFGYQGDAGYVLDGFEFVEGAPKVGAAADDAVVAEEDGVVVRDEGLDGFAEGWGAGETVGGQGDAA